MNDFNNISNFSPTYKPQRRWNKGVMWFFIILVLIAGLIGAHWVYSALENQNIDGSSDNSLWNKIVQSLPLSDNKPSFGPEYVIPAKEPNRIDILILGMRGDNDPNGGELTDTIMLLSYDTVTHKSALISIPRDLYLTIEPGLQDKINSAYERLGLAGTARLFSRITGVYVDHVVVIDFTAFKDLVDQLGGIDIYLDKPFSETEQWGYTFSLPAGDNHLNGDQALYYARSRFTSNDFDRAARQQKIIMAIRQKAQALDLLSDPLKALAIFNTINSHVTTDISVFELKQFINMAQNLSGTNIKHEVISTDNLLYNTKFNGIYILLPKGDSLVPIKTFFKNVLN